MENSYDIIVIGVGAMGSAASWQLARRGVRVLGLEQFDIPNTLGSSHGHSRMIRLAYYEHPDYVPLLRRAYELWHEIERESTEKILHLTGGLYLGPHDSKLIHGSLESARRHGLPHEALSAADVRKRFPMFNVPDDFVALFETNAGFLVPETAIAAHAKAATRAGAEIHAQEAVIDWSADASGVRVRTDRAEYHAAHLIFCGGAWSGKLLKDLSINLVVTRQVMGWVRPPDPAPFALGRFPVWAIDNPTGGFYYGFPISSDEPGRGEPVEPGLKIALHAPGAPTDPDRVTRDTLPGDEDGFLTALRRYLPTADGPTVALRVCLYTNSPDSHFIIDRHPRHGNVTIACGFSGHGFKFSSVIGEVLAEMAMAGKTTLPVKFLGFDRFRRGRGA